MTTIHSPVLCDACREHPAFLVLAEIPVCSICASSFASFELLAADGDLRNSSTLRVTAASERRSKSSLSVMCSLLCCVRGIGLWANQASRDGGGQRHLRNNCSQNLRSVAPWSRSPMASSPDSGLPSASSGRAENVRSGTPTCLSRASADQAFELLSQFIPRSFHERRAAC